MASVALTHLTTLLQARKLDGTLTRPLSLGLPTTSTGVEALDRTLARWSDHSVRAEVAEASRGAGAPGDQRKDGWPRGHVSEIVGPASSGRTSVVMATFAGVTARGGVV